MTRQRKTHLLLLALVPILAFGVVRCVDSPSAPSASAPNAGALTPDVATRLAKLHAQFDWIGAYHNDALKYVLGSLQRIPAKNLNRRVICETAIAAYRDFHRSRRGVEMPAEVAADAEKSCASGGLGASTATFSLQLPAGFSRTDLSPDAQAYLDQMLSAVDAANSSDEFNAAIAGIESSAAASLSDAEAGAVITVGAVAQSSEQYWESNLDAWLPYTSIALNLSRVAPSRLSGDDAGRIGPSGTPRLNFWSDFVSAGKRALRGDVAGAAKAVVSAGLLGVPIVYDVVLAGAATGSVMAVLQI